jgi:hypothetical protein
VGHAYCEWQLGQAPGSLTIRTSAETALVKNDMMTTDASAPATNECHFINTLPTGMIRLSFIVARFGHLSCRNRAAIDFRRASKSSQNTTTRQDEAREIVNQLGVKSAGEGHHFWLSNRGYFLSVLSTKITHQNLASFRSREPKVRRLACTRLFPPWARVLSADRGDRAAATTAAVYQKVSF